MTLETPPPPEMRSRRLVWIVVAVTLIGVRIAIAVFFQDGTSRGGGCERDSEGGAILSASGAVAMQDAGFNIEDDDCFWDYRTEMYLDFDGPAPLYISARGLPGELTNVEIYVATESVVLSTEIVANRSACFVIIEAWTPERLVGSFECTKLVAAHYTQGSIAMLVADPDLPLTNLAGTFVLVPES
jgi:hypothetical protein